MDKPKSLFKSVIFKSIILTVLPIIYPIILSLAFSLPKISDVAKCITITVAILMFILHIVVIVLYGKNESRNNQELDNKRQEIKLKAVSVSSNLLLTYKKSIEENANKMNEVMDGKKTKVDIANWYWLYARGDEICTSIRTFIEDKIVGEGKFSVSLMFRKQNGEESGYTMLSRSSLDSSYNPNSYRKFISEKEAEGAYYKTIFDSNSTDPDILMNEKEIKKHFKKPVGAKYSQYIGLPISCKGKTVGVLQIVGYEGAKISADKAVVTGFCNNYFAVAVNLVLLAEKTEKIIQLVEG